MIHPYHNFMRVKGGMDVLELFRFKKEPFMVLVGVLEIPDTVVPIPLLANRSLLAEIYVVKYTISLCMMRHGE